MSGRRVNTGGEYVFQVRGQEFKLTSLVGQPATELTLAGVGIPEPIVVASGALFLGAIGGIKVKEAGNKRAIREAKENANADEADEENQQAANQAIADALNDAEVGGDEPIQAHEVEEAIDYEQAVRDLMLMDV